MTHTQSVVVAAQATFGRDGAMFEGLLGFVAQLSVVLWGLVILTAVIRFVGIRIYRRGAARTALVETVAPSAAVPSAAVLTPAVPTTIVLTTAVPAARAGKDAVLVPAELVDVLAADAATNVTSDEVLQPAAAPAAVAASVKVPHAPRNRRAEPRSGAHVPALAANSTKV